jgi:hypothetical protein
MLDKCGMYGAPEEIRAVISRLERSGLVRTDKVDEYGIVAITDAGERVVEGKQIVDGVALLRESNVFDGQVSSGPVVRGARPVVSNKIIGIHHFNDAETTGLRSVSFQGEVCGRFISVSASVVSGEDMPYNIWLRPFTHRGLPKVRVSALR